MLLDLSALAALRPRACLPPIWREAPFLLTRRDSRRTQFAAPRRDAPPVILIPGLFMGDRSLCSLADHLARTGFSPFAAGVDVNVDCSEATVSRLVRRLDEIADRCGERVSLVGQSRGGLFARVMARRRPELVAGVVTLGSPQRDQLAIHPLLWAQAATLAALGSLGVSGLFRFGCVIGSCCRDFERDLAAPVPAGVGYLSIFSSLDGIVDWRACVDAGGRHREVATAHCEMGTHVASLWTVTDALSSFASAGRRASHAGPSAGAAEIPASNRGQLSAPSGGERRQRGAARRGRANDAHVNAAEANVGVSAQGQARRRRGRRC